MRWSTQAMVEQIEATEEQHVEHPVEHPVGYFTAKRIVKQLIAEQIVERLTAEQVVERLTAEGVAVVFIVTTTELAVVVVSTAQCSDQQLVQHYSLLTRSVFMQG